MHDTPTTDASDNSVSLAETEGNCDESRIDKAFQTMEKIAFTHVAPAYLLGASLFGAYLQAALPEQLTARAMTTFYVLTLGPLFAYATWRVSVLRLEVFDVALTERVFAAIVFCIVQRGIHAWSEEGC